MDHLRKLSDQYRLWANGSVDIPTACVMSRIYASVRKFGKAATVLKESAEAHPGATVPEDAWRWLLLAARQEKLFVIAKKIVQTVHELYGDRPIPGDLYVLLVDCAAAVPESKFVSAALFDALWSVDFVFPYLSCTDLCSTRPGRP